MCDRLIFLVMYFIDNEAVDSNNGTGSEEIASERSSDRGFINDGTISHVESVSQWESNGSETQEVEREFEVDNNNSVSVGTINSWQSAISEFCGTSSSEQQCSPGYSYNEELLEFLPENEQANSEGGNARVSARNDITTFNLDEFLTNHLQSNDIDSVDEIGESTLVSRTKKNSTQR